MPPMTGRDTGAVLGEKDLLYGDFLRPTFGATTCRVTLGSQFSKPPDFTTPPSDIAYYFS